MKMLAKKHCSEFTEEDFEMDEFGFYEEVENVFRGNIDYISEFSGEAQYVSDDGVCDWGCDTIYFSGSYLYYVPINRRMTLFEAAYKDMDDMIADFKERIGEYMPEDFDYRNNIRFIVGTYWG